MSLTDSNENNKPVTDQSSTADQQVIPNETPVRILKERIKSDQDDWFQGETAHISGHAGQDARTGYSIDGDHGKSTGLTLDEDFALVEKPTTPTAQSANPDQPDDSNLTM